MDKTKSAQHPGFDFTYSKLSLIDTQDIPDLSGIWLNVKAIVTSKIAHWQTKYDNFLKLGKKSIDVS